MGHALLEELRTATPKENLTLLSGRRNDVMGRVELVLIVGSQVEYGRVFVATVLRS